MALHGTTSVYISHQMPPACRSEPNQFILLTELAPLMSDYMCHESCIGHVTVKDVPKLWYTAFGVSNHDVTDVTR